MEKIQEMFKGVLAQTADVLEPSQNTRFISNVFIKQKSNAAKVALQVGNESFSDDFIMQYGDALHIETNMILPPNEKLSVFVDGYAFSLAFDAALKQKFRTVFGDTKRVISIAHGAILAEGTESSGANNNFHVYDYHLNEIFKIHRTYYSSSAPLIIKTGVIFSGETTSKSYFVNMRDKKAYEFSGNYGVSKYGNLIINRGGFLLENGKIATNPTLNDSKYLSISDFWSGNGEWFSPNSANKFVINVKNGRYVSLVGDNNNFYILNKTAFYREYNANKVRTYDVSNLNAMLAGSELSPSIGVKKEYSNSNLSGICNNGVFWHKDGNTLKYFNNGSVNSVSLNSAYTTAATEGSVSFVYDNTAKAIKALDMQGAELASISSQNSVNMDFIISGADKILVVGSNANSTFLYDKAAKTFEILNIYAASLSGDDEAGYTLISYTTLSDTLRNGSKSYKYNVNSGELKEIVEALDTDTPEVFIKIDGVEISD
ncbi:hypothetical protein CFT12S00416_05520 [Campylobacter fetus subsp. testudinum]|uniref:hypothetical protein n=1 Tax=Campylobacter fetus TaxID=196 RepID=UPI000818786F|nr:hypothetical protein [Campylobacter fetus]OCR88883.1 hypothetical protein CFT12S00416_05520 [Campylobacter fetus subsp. testudinum]